MKAPSHSSPAYVCKAIKKILKSKGWPLHTMSGRYTPFCNTQVGTEGFSVRKVGCSKSVSVYYSAGYGDGRSREIPRDYRKAKETEAWALLKELGYRISDIGWIECEGYDLNDM